MKKAKLETHNITIDKEKNRVRLDEKRCLTVDELQAYYSIGKNNALKLIRQSGCGMRVGKKILVDRVRLDRWLEQKAEENGNPKVLDLLSEEE